jgi:hypothetical protein
MAVWKVRELTSLLRVGTLWRCGDGLFSKYLHLQAMHFLQHSTHLSKTCCRPLNASKFLASELPSRGWKNPEISWGRDLNWILWIDGTPLEHPPYSPVSSVGIALGNGLDDRGSRVRFPAEAGNFSLHHHVQNGSGAHPASYPMGTRGCFPGG